MKNLVGASILVLAACASQLSEFEYFGEVPETGYQLRSEANHLSRSFVVSLESRSNRPLCIGWGLWPNQYARMDVAPERLYAVLEGIVYPTNAGRMGLGVCVLRCATYVAPNAKITSAIPFSYFDLPPDIQPDQDLRLVYNLPAPAYCKLVPIDVPAQLQSDL